MTSSGIVLPQPCWVTGVVIFFVYIQDVANITAGSPVGISGTIINFFNQELEFNFVKKNRTIGKGA